MFPAPLSPPPHLWVAVWSLTSAHTLTLLSDSWLAAGSSPHSISENTNTHLNSGCSATHTSFTVVPSSFPKSGQFLGVAPDCPGVLATGSSLFGPYLAQEPLFTSHVRLGATGGRYWSPGRVITIWGRPNDHGTPVNCTHTHTHTHFVVVVKSCNDGKDYFCLVLYSNL